ncbi:hypothetical protein R1flu_018605 [Riccia fluitans]|uniref:Uncharacterized protein n=1 Tax=Riccia fluitans TaxID=41844 RepID=A0ABD1ZGC4_9MARC
MSNRKYANLLRIKSMLISNELRNLPLRTQMPEMKRCVMVQTDFRDEESQHLYADCQYHSEPEPDSLINGVGLEYPEISDREMDPECSSVCLEKQERWCRKPMLAGDIPTYMKRIVSSYSNQKSLLVFPHRNDKPPLKRPHNKTLAEQYVILEPLHTLSYAGLEYLESCLSFESILDKLKSSGGDPSESRPRAVALRLLLRLPAQPQGDLEGQPTSSGNRTEQHNRIHLSVKSKHYRVLTPRCDTSIIQQLGRNSAIVLLQKFLRGRSKMIALEKMKARWEETYTELNGLGRSHKPKGVRSLMDLDTGITERAIVKTLVGQFLGVMLESRVISSMSSPITGNWWKNVKSR